jgi:hypothetical protein
MVTNGASLIHPLPMIPPSETVITLKLMSITAPVTDDGAKQMVTALALLQLSSWSCAICEYVTQEVYIKAGVPLQLIDHKPPQMQPPHDLIEAPNIANSMGSPLLPPCPHPTHPHLA